MDLIARLQESVANKSQKWPCYTGGYIDRNEYLTSSENIRCLRELKFNKTNNVPFDAWGYAERGHSVEAWIVNTLEEGLFDHEKLEFHGFMQKSFVDGKLSGTPDGLLHTDQGVFLLEFKSVDPRTNLEAMGSPKKQHEAQVQQNMHLLHRNGVVVESAIVLYVDASDFKRMRQFDVKFDRNAAAWYAERAETLLDAKSPADLPAEGLTNHGCGYCQFKEQCSELEGGTSEPQKPPKMPEFAPRGIATTLRKYMQAKEGAAVLKTQMDDLAAELKSYAQENDTTLIESSKYTATVKTVAGRRTLDVAAYEEATGVAADDFYKVGKPSLRLEVKNRD